MLETKFCETLRFFNVAQKENDETFSANNFNLLTLYWYVFTNTCKNNNIKIFFSNNMTFSRANDVNFLRELLLSENFFKLIDFQKLVLSYI